MHHKLIAAMILFAAPLAAAGDARTYEIDSAKSEVSAKVPFFGIASKTATFPRMSGAASLPANSTAGMKLEVALDARALTAPDTTTLKRLKSEKFFWVDRYPTVRFTGEGMTMRDATHGTISGKLTARGVTMPTKLEVRFAADPAGVAPDAPLDLVATTKIDRRAFGMTAYPLIVGKTVSITIHARMVPR